MAEVLQDKWGYEVKTNSEACISAINSYYNQVLCYGRKRDVILEAPKADPHCVLGNILAAHFLCSSDPSKASPFLDAAKSTLENATAFEKKVFDAVSYMISKDRDDDVAVELHSKLLKDFPRDLVSLKRVQLLCFYMGRPDLSLQSIEQVLPYNEQEQYIHGMLAFVFLELGRMVDAEKAAKTGLEICKEDAWAQHANNIFSSGDSFLPIYMLILLLENNGHYAMFINTNAISKRQRLSWMNVHNHGTLYRPLCTHTIGGMFPFVTWKVNPPLQEEIYDGHIWKELDRSDAAPAEVYLNAAALLLRIYVRGETKRFEDRLKSLANCLADRGVWFLEWHLDLLIVWALTYMGYVAEAEDLVKGLESKVSQMSKKKQQLMQRGVSLAKALSEYAKGEYQKALEFLGLEFDAVDYKMVGASDEQLDIFNEIWYDVLINTGHTTKAIQAIEKQLNKREGTPFLWRLLEKCYIKEGRPEAAKIGEKASTLEITYFN